MTSATNSTPNVKVQTRRSPAKQPHPADDLSFMHCRQGGGGINYWNVEPSGSYTRDCDKGHELAQEYLAYIGKHPTNGNATLLGCIINDMCRVRQEKQMPSRNHVTGLEIGFLMEVNKYAMSVAKLIATTMGDPAQVEAQTARERLNFYAREFARAARDIDPLATECWVGDGVGDNHQRYSVIVSRKVQP